LEICWLALHFSGLKHPTEVSCIQAKGKRKGQTKMTNYQKFVTELEKLSVKYGASIQSIGGVSIWEDGELESIDTKDETSGDIYPRTINGEKY